MLKFTFIANACGTFTGSQGTRILCDPWLVDGAFDSWCHYPPLKTKPEDVLDVDAVYVSHIHPDHFDERHFRFDKAKPILVLDHQPNYLIKKLESLGFTNLYKIPDGQTLAFREFEITMFAPFAKHSFHPADVGNLIDSAMLIECGGVKALNCNDNTLTVEAALKIRHRFGSIDLLMHNYNTAGPYPSCFTNLTEIEKASECRRLLDRNLKHLRLVTAALGPRFVLPFAGAYVLGGKAWPKNKYLATTTADEAARGVPGSVCLREGDTLDIATGIADKPYVPIDVKDQQQYIEQELIWMKYPYESMEMPDEFSLVTNVMHASVKMRNRMERLGLKSTFEVLLYIFGKRYRIYPDFQAAPTLSERRLECTLDERLLRAILDRRAQWNNAEIGCHIVFYRTPNEYEVDLHTGLQMFHL
jgi:UDP-MurNAc hydroxylase